VRSSLPGRFELLVLGLLAVFTASKCWEDAALAAGPRNAASFSLASDPEGLKSDSGAHNVRIKTLMIEQHGAVVGAQLVYVSSNAVRFDCQKRGTFIVAKAPGWRVYSYSPQTRKWFDTPLSAYRVLSNSSCPELFEKP
jgi:hypothetical protein